MIILQGIVQGCAGNFNIHSNINILDSYKKEILCCGITLAFITAERKGLPGEKK
jgi:hypothetical protein